MPNVRSGAIFWEHRHRWAAVMCGKCTEATVRSCAEGSGVWTERSHSLIVHSAGSYANVHSASAIAMTASLELFGASEASARSIAEREPIAWAPV